MKIVHICLCGPVTDGWNYQDNMLTKYHKKLGYDVTLITSQWIWGEGGKLELLKRSNYINSDGVKIIRLAILKNRTFLSKFKRFDELNENLKSESPDIIFIHGIQFLDINNIVKYLKINNNIKVFVDNHCDFSNSATNWISKNILHKIIWKRMANKIEPYTEKFYGVTPARVDFLVDMYKLPKEKLELLVMGADDEKVEAVKDKKIIDDLKSKYSISESDFVIVTGGKIDEAKKQTLLLMEAISQINRDDIKLIVFGSVAESLKNRFMNLCNDEKIKYAGWVSADDSYKYFEMADLVVFPGRHSVFWEQVVAQGKPMLCKYWDGTTHVDVGGNVTFLYKDNSDEIYNNIISLIEDENKLVCMKETAKTKGAFEFSYKNIAEKSLGA